MPTETTESIMEATASTVQEMTTASEITTASETTGPSLLDWGEWEDCTASCGDGIQTRQRADCDYDPGVCIEEKDCNIGICPGWGDWRPWGMCSGNGLLFKL